MPSASTPSEYSTQYWEPTATGPVFQVDETTWTGITPPPATIAAAGNYTSAVIPADGFKVLCAAITSTQVGAISIQRYIDKAGTIAQGAAISTALVASTPAVVNSNDGLPFQSFTVKITNTSGSLANLSAFALLMNAA